MERTIFHKEKKMITITADNFQEEKNKGKLLVEIFAPGCSPCKRMKDDVLPEINKQNLVIGMVDATQQMDVVHQIQEESGRSIMSVPVLVFYKNGVYAGRKDGFASIDDVEKLIS
jgi:thiol-disulfide isomerase/thioredoxin